MNFEFTPNLEDSLNGLSRVSTDHKIYPLQHRL